MPSQMIYMWNTCGTYLQLGTNSESLLPVSQVSLTSAGITAGSSVCHYSLCSSQPTACQPHLYWQRSLPDMTMHLSTTLHTVTPLGNV